MVVTEFVIAESILITEAWQENSPHACGSTLRHVVHAAGRTYEITDNATSFAHEADPISLAGPLYAP
jgi:hypothetical protein